ncbi:MAG: hypothetical protein IJ192_01445 [Clostridia bacterium]|nr:hypothetical protein [Clostridia bacterium]
MNEKSTKTLKIVNLVLMGIVTAAGVAFFIFGLVIPNADKHLFSCLFWGDILLLEIIRVFYEKLANGNFQILSIILVVLLALALVFTILGM